MMHPFCVAIGSNTHSSVPEESASSFLHSSTLLSEILSCEYLVVIKASGPSCDGTILLEG